jgi:hypothetical protein
LPEPGLDTRFTTNAAVGEDLPVRRGVPVVLGEDVLLDLDDPLRRGSRGVHRPERAGVLRIVPMPVAVAVAVPAGIGATPLGASFRRPGRMVVCVITVVFVRVHVHAAVGVSMLVHVRCRDAARRHAVRADADAVDPRFPVATAASRAHRHLLCRIACTTVRRSRFP